MQPASALRWRAGCAVRQRQNLRAIDPADFDAIYFTGIHAVMWDYPDDAGRQRLTREIDERGGIVSSVCPGYRGLLNPKLSDSSLLVAGRRITGYAWLEEILAGVANKVPCNVEQQMQQRGARYEKALLPFTSNVVVDGRLVTGQILKGCESRERHRGKRSRSGCR
nr:type 1 glutamine amidotransferase domain-containing protein [Burkholderia sp. BCC0405]